MNASQKDEELMPPILCTIDGESDLAQRRLARSLGVALGLADRDLKDVLIYRFQGHPAALNVAIERARS